MLCGAFPDSHTYDCNVLPCNNYNNSSFKKEISTGYPCLDANSHTDDCNTLTCMNQNCFCLLRRKPYHIFAFRRK